MEASRRGAQPCQGVTWAVPMVALGRRVSLTPRWESCHPGVQTGCPTILLLKRCLLPQLHPPAACQDLVTPRSSKGDTGTSVPIATPLKSWPRVSLQPETCLYQGCGRSGQPAQIRLKPRLLELLNIQLHDAGLNLRWEKPRSPGRQPGAVRVQSRGRVGSGMPPSITPPPLPTQAAYKETTND